MFRLTHNRWLRRIALGAVAAIGLGAATLPAVPAKADVWVGFGAPAYSYYYPPAPYYGSYGYYPYNYYGYPAGGVYFGFGGGWHHHHWR
jgi:hypothetical protein